MYIATVTFDFHSVESPALIYHLNKGEQITNIDNATLMELLNRRLIKKIATFKTVDEVKHG